VSVSVSVFVVSTADVAGRVGSRLRLIGCTVELRQVALRAHLVRVDHDGLAFLRVWAIVRRLDPLYAWTLTAAPAAEPVSSV
jgi:hypothetical protein